MRFIFLSGVILILLSISACGAQEECRGRAVNEKMIKKQPQKLMASIYRV